MAVETNSDMFFVLLCSDETGSFPRAFSRPKVVFVYAITLPTKVVYIIHACKITLFLKLSSIAGQKLSVCECVCLCVKQVSTNHNCYM